MGGCFVRRRARAGFTALVPHSMWRKYPRNAAGNKDKVQPFYFLWALSLANWSDGDSTLV